MHLCADGGAYSIVVIDVGLFRHVGRFVQYFCTVVPFVILEGCMCMSYDTV